MSVDRAADGVPRKPRATHRVQSVERAVALLKATAAAPHPASVWELARTCGVNRSTAWRLLGTLEAQGLVERDPVTQRYTIGYEAIQVAGAAGYDGLARRVRPLLQRLAETAGESVTLAAARDAEAEVAALLGRPGGRRAAAAGSRRRGAAAAAGRQATGEQDAARSDEQLAAREGEPVDVDAGFWGADLHHRNSLHGRAR